MSKPGVLLVGHGTRDELGTQEFFQLGELLAKRCGSIPVEPALLEFQSPTIPEGWRALAAQGATHVHVAPLLLFAAGHAKSDIPDMIGQCQTDSRGITSDQSRPLSRHPSIVKLASKRVREALGNIQADLARTAFVMVGRGSHDPCASADMRVLTKVVQTRLQLHNAWTAFYAMAQPRLPEVLDDIASEGRFDNVIVYPHLLFHGRLYQAIQKQTEEANARFPNLRFQTTGYLGANALVADAIAGRINLIQNGSAKAKCDRIGS